MCQIKHKVAKWPLYALFETYFAPDPAKKLEMKCAVNHAAFSREMGDAVVDASLARRLYILFGCEDGISSLGSFASFLPLCCSAKGPD
jgi:hypothetical protein